MFYLDMDCILYRSPKFILKTDFDVGVIYRFNWKQDLGRHDCLGGFLLFPNRRPDVENQFLERLIEKTTEWYEKELSMGQSPWFYDQYAINDLVGQPLKLRTKEEYYIGQDWEPQIKKVDGVRILFLSANVWASPMTIIPRQDLVLIHYNHTLWPKIGEAHYSSQNTTN